MAAQGRTVDQRIAGMAARAHGVLTRRELLAAGVTRAQIARRIQRGTLIRAHAGVYRVGHAAPTIEARYLAAVRACGEGALLSGRAAAYLHGLLRGEPPRPHVVTRVQRTVVGVRTTRCRHLDRRDASVRRGIPVTSVPRTLVDVAALLAPDHLARACHEADVLHGTTPEQVEAVLARRPTSPGARKLRAILYGHEPVTLSALERAFLRRLEQAGLPPPEMNTEADGRRVDCRWPAHRLTVELDGYRFHRSRHAWEQDRRREREARARGDEFRRYTYGDVLEDPPFMLVELRSLLGERNPAA